MIPRDANQMHRIDIRDMPVYIAHYTPAAERKRFMTKQLASIGFKRVTFIESFDREVLTPEDYATYDPSLQKARERFGEIRTTMLENAAFNGSKKSWSEGVDYSAPLPPLRALVPGDISASLKHITAWRTIAVGAAPFGLVLDNDAIFLKDFVKNFGRNLGVTPEDWQVIFIGSGARLRVPERTEGVFAYKMNPPRSKCADSYLIKPAAAEVLCRSVIPFMQAIDWEMAYWMQKLDLSTYWWEPPIVVQGSEIGAFKSTIGR